ncbi:MAG: Phage integrase [Frankiales bacterium]|nr:Phage integrase [Frankiales bacterium]
MADHKRRGYGDGGVSPYDTAAGERFSIVFRAFDPKRGESRQFRERGFKTRREAQTALRQRVAEAEAGQHVAPDAETLADWVERWLVAEKTQVRPSTWSSYSRNLQLHVVPALASKRLQHLRPSYLSGLYARLLEGGRADHASGRGLSPRTVRYIHTILRKCLQGAVDEEGLLQTNPAAKAKPPKASASGDKHTKISYWTGPQVGQFLERTAYQRHHAAWLLLATTGMRRGEALGLAWADLDLEVGRLSVRRTLVDLLAGAVPVWSDPKTAKWRRTVDLDERTVAVLRSHRASQARERLSTGPSYEQHDLVPAMPDGRPVHPERSSRDTETVARSDLPRIRPHDLRHTWAVLALQAGVHPKVVQERLGHSGISFTLDTYSHVLPARQTNAAAQVAALIFGSTPSRRTRTDPVTVRSHTSLLAWKQRV